MIAVEKVDSPVLAESPASESQSSSLDEAPAAIESPADDLAQELAAPASADKPPAETASADVRTNNANNEPAG